jgi:hypothetical protein
MRRKSAPVSHHAEYERTAATRGDSPVEVGAVSPGSG